MTFTNQIDEYQKAFIDILKPYGIVTVYPSYCYNEGKSFRSIKIRVEDKETTNLFYNHLINFNKYLKEENKEQIYFDLTDSDFSYGDTFNIIISAKEEIVDKLIIYLKMVLG